MTSFHHWVLIRKRFRRGNVGFLSVVAESIEEWELLKFKEGAGQ